MIKSKIGIPEKILNKSEYLSSFMQLSPKTKILNPEILSSDKNEDVNDTFSTRIKQPLRAATVLQQNHKQPVAVEVC